LPISFITYVNQEVNEFKCMQSLINFKKFFSADTDTSLNVYFHNTT